MIQKICPGLEELLHRYNILLGSKSPRRRALLTQLDIPYTVVDIKGVREEYPADMEARQVPLHIARLKADGYAELLQVNELLITADTVVIDTDDNILGKPATDDEAVRMLLHLSAREHQVVTGVVITACELRREFSAVTTVHFAEIDRAAAEYYVRNYHPLDKAGAYGIQEWIGAAAVQSIEGSYYNVMGLPVCRLLQELKSICCSGE